MSRSRILFVEWRIAKHEMVRQVAIGLEMGPVYTNRPNLWLGGEQQAM